MGISGISPTLLGLLLLHQIFSLFLFFFFYFCLSHRLFFFYLHCLFFLQIFYLTYICLSTSFSFVSFHFVFIFYLFVLCGLWSLHVYIYFFNFSMYAKCQLLVSVRYNDKLYIFCKLN